MTALNTNVYNTRKLAAALEDEAKQLRALTVDPANNTLEAWEADLIITRAMTASVTKDAAALRAEAKVLFSQVSWEADKDGAYFLTHKIAAIKELRQRTGCGLKEAKDAVEQVHPQAIREHIIKMVTELSNANGRAGFAYTAYLKPSDLGSTLGGDW